MKRFIVFRFNTQFIRLAIVCIMLLSAIGQAYAADAIIDDSECTWRLVSSTYALKVGDEVVIAASDYDFAIDTLTTTTNEGKPASPEMAILSHSAKTSRFSLFNQALQMALWPSTLVEVIFMPNPTVAII